MPYCSIHSIDHRSDDCPRCAAEERHRELLESAEDRNSELIEATESSLQESDYRRANPGDYECPHCRYVSLKYRASRCPLCRGEVDRAYWDSVDEREAIALAVKQKKKEEAATAKKEAAEREAARMRSPEYIASVAAQVAEGKRRQRKKNCVTGLERGAFFGGTVIGLSGFVHCFYHLRNLTLEPLSYNYFNLFTGVFWGVLAGGIIGALIGSQIDS